MDAKENHIFAQTILIKSIKITYTAYIISIALFSNFFQKSDRVKVKRWLTLLFLESYSSTGRHGVNFAK